MARHFLYIADPMCSWCYGFQPAVTAIAAHFEPTVPLRIMLGGLRAGNTRAVRPEDKAFFRTAWAKVSAATGRSFDAGFFERDGFVYDTEPACRAVVTARSLDPARALEMKGRVSAAFYGANRDTTAADVLCDIAAEAGFDRETFRLAFHSADVRNETFRDFLQAKQMGVEGFPCLLLSHGAGYAMVTQGYRPLDGMIDGIEAFLAAQASIDVAAAP